jgi:hypothetical protein
MEANGSETEEITWSDSDDGSVEPNVDMDGGRCRRPEIRGRNDMVMTERQRRSDTSLSVIAWERVLIMD